MQDSTADFFGALPRTEGVRRTNVRIGALVDGTPITLPIVAVRGAPGGPTVYLQAGIHGDELTGIAVATEVIRGISAEDVRGALIVIPIANPGGFITRSRGFLLEERGPIDPNRTYPGNAGGLHTERLLNLLFNQCILPADVTIDLHSALAGCAIAAFSYIDPDDDQNGTLGVREDLAMAFDGDFVYRKPRTSKLGTSDMSRSLAAKADEHGKAAMTIELGESERVDWSLVRRGASGVINMLRATQVLSGKATRFTDRPSFSNIKPVHADHAGIFRPRVEIGDRVAEGSVLGDVTDVRNQKRRLVRSPNDGYVLRLMRRPSIMPGAELAWVVW